MVSLNGKTEAMARIPPEMDLQATMHDNVLRWRVASRTRPDIAHVTDLGEHDGFGACSCEHFEFRVLPAIQAGQPTGGRCLHLMAARQAFTDLMIQKLKI